MAALKRSGFVLDKVDSPKAINCEPDSLFKFTCSVRHRASLELLLRKKHFLFVLAQIQIIAKRFLIYPSTNCGVNLLSRSFGTVEHSNGN